MIPTLNGILESIRASLEQCKTEHSYQIIEYILGAWGGVLVENAELRTVALGDDHSGTDSIIVRYPSAGFWHALGAIPLTRSLRVPASAQPKNCQPETMAATITLWANQLAHYPLHEATRAFAVMVHRWLQTCDLQTYMKPGYSELDALRDIYGWWGTELSVD